MRIVELVAERDDLHAFVVIDHDHFPVCAGGTRMLADVDAPEVARLTRAMTWKFAGCRVPYGGAKAGVRFGAVTARLCWRRTGARSSPIARCS